MNYQENIQYLQENSVILTPAKSDMCIYANPFIISPVGWGKCKL